MQVSRHDDGPGAPIIANKPGIPRPERKIEQLKLPRSVHVKAPGVRKELATVETAIRFIDKNVPRELATLPRWTFARALLLEALKTQKRRDLQAAVRQLMQAVSNERWMDRERNAT
jgi:hypothetical protein